jgi:hypothetical protein
VAHPIAKLAAIGAAVISLAACTMTSEPMEAEDGSFVITSTADAYGSQAIAVRAAQADAQKFCVQQGKRAVAVTASRQDGATGGFLLANSGGLSGGAFTLRYNADLRFRCV